MPTSARIPFLQRIFPSAWIGERFRPISFGERGEREAVRYLKRLGYKIVFSRYRQDRKSVV